MIDDSFQALVGSVVSCDQCLQLLDEINIGAFTVDNARRVSSINLSAQALLGLKKKEVLGRDCREVFCGVPCLATCMFRGRGEPSTDEPDIEIFDEKEKRHLVTRLAACVYDFERNNVGCLTIIQDYSPIADLINRIHYEERTLKIILENLDVGIFTVNREGLITFFNAEAEKITGNHRRQVIGRVFKALFEADANPGLHPLEESMEDGKARSSRQRKMVARTGEVIPVRANYFPLRNEKEVIVGGLVTFRDLTLVYQLNQVIRDRYTFHDMIGKDPAMQKIFEMVEVVAKTDSTVLIEGATGTGKDILAKVIHSASRRAEKSLVKVNCAAIPENLLESELFGYVKGAFTGADRDKPGRFQEADRGTIFLDEIGDLPLSLQAKLLRVLEDKEFYPLGSRRTMTVDVRIISATNRGLGGLVEKGLFREDLFYRLNVFRIELPSLKNRRVDVPILIRHIMRKLCTAMDIPVREISEQAMDLLLNFHYPGNVRELENILEHALIICKEEIVQPGHLPEYLRHQRITSGQSLLPEEDHALQEKEKILRALRQTRGNRKKTARALEMDRTTLWRKMKKLGLEV